MYAGPHALNSNLILLILEQRLTIESVNGFKFQSDSINTWLHATRKRHEYTLNSNLILLIPDRRGPGYPCEQL